MNRRLPFRRGGRRDFTRMSGKSVTARTSITPQARPSRRRQLTADRGVGSTLREPSQPTTYRARMVERLPRSAGRRHVLQRDRHRAVRRHRSRRRSRGGRRTAAGRRRALHVVAEVGEHPRLVDDDVRELRQALLDVLDAAGADDPVPSSGSARQKAVSLTQYASAQQTVGEAERLEHLDGAAGDAVRLPDLERPVPAIDDRVGDPGSARAARQDQAGRAAADDEHVGLLREAGGPPATDGWGPRRADRRCRSR